MYNGKHLSRDEFLLMNTQPVWTHIQHALTRLPGKYFYLVHTCVQRDKEEGGRECVCVGGGGGGQYHIKNTSNINFVYFPWLLENASVLYIQCTCVCVDSILSKHSNSKF